MANTNRGDPNYLRFLGWSSLRISILSHFKADDDVTLQHIGGDPDMAGSSSKAQAGDTGNLHQSRTVFFLGSPKISKKKKSSQNRSLV